MTAMSAPCATGAAATPNADPATIRLPGSSRTYEARESLKGLGLRWDPVTHAWHGTLPAAQAALLERRFGLRPQVVTPIEAFAPETVPAIPAPERPRQPVGSAPPTRGRARDGSRTRVEAALVFAPGRWDDDADGEDEGRDRRRFSLLDVTSGLPDDSRAADERAAERHLRDLRGRVKAARAALAAHPAAEERLRADQRAEAAFLARFGVTREQLRQGVPSTTAPEPADLRELLRYGLDGSGEGHARTSAAFPCRAA